MIADRALSEELVTEPTRLWMSLCAVLVTACGAGDTRLDPSDLELRDLLGLSPEVASSWDGAQRSAARAVIEAGLRQRPAAPARAALGDDAGGAGDAAADAVIDRRIAKALASIDVDRARHRAGALGAVAVAVDRSAVVATPRAATLAPRAAPAVDLELRGWTEPGWSELPARGMDVLAALASDAGHPGGALVVAPRPELAVVAGYLPASAGGPARLVVNPVVLAALEPRAPGTAAAQAAVSTAPAAGAAQADDGPIGNPYSFYGSVAECAAAQQRRCDACLADSSCTTITGTARGDDECRQFAAGGGRGYSLICINLALAVDAVASCAAGSAPSCPRDVAASRSLSSLEANARFLDDAVCASPLDACLAKLYGAPSGGFPGSGSDGGPGRPRDTEIDCGDSCNGDANCDASPGCELDGPTCDAATDGECSEPDESSSCDGGNTGEAGDSCSGDGEDACGSESSSNSCDSSDCGGGGDSDCSSSGGESSCDGGGGGGDCDSGGGGGDCGGGGGGDCSGGGGGDCGGGGGGDCNVAGKRGRAGASLPVAIAWALLPVPLAAFVRRRAERRRPRDGGEP